MDNLDKELKNYSSKIPLEFYEAFGVLQEDKKNWILDIFDMISKYDKEELKDAKHVVSQLTNYISKKYGIITTENMIYELERFELFANNYIGRKRLLDSMWESYLETLKGDNH